MDISVSRLNKRMALQLPAEFPLGLVFVVGEVKNLSYYGDGVTVSDFYIEEYQNSTGSHTSQEEIKNITIT